MGGALWWLETDALHVRLSVSLTGGARCASVSGLESINTLGCLDPGTICFKSGPEGRRDAPGLQILKALALEIKEANISGCFASGNKESKHCWIELNSLMDINLTRSAPNVASALSLVHLWIIVLVVAVNVVEDSCGIVDSSGSGAVSLGGELESFYLLF